MTDRLCPLISTTLEREDLHERTDHTLHDPIRLLYVGYLKDMKGLPDLIDALAILRRDGENVELHLVGAGPEEGALRDQVRHRGLVDRVHFHGYVVMGPDLNRHYDQADVFVFASLSEGSPRVVLEAMAHSVPVVSTPVGSVPELIEDEKRGLLVPCGDSQAMARGVSRMIHNDALRIFCAKAGHVFAKDITVDKLVAPMVAKAKELARKGGSKQS